MSTRSRPRCQWCAEPLKVPERDLCAPCRAIRHRLGEREPVTRALWPLDAPVGGRTVPPVGNPGELGYLAAHGRT
jgi:hypothetical protein